MPPHKWVDNAELSVPDQMTNITEKTRPQSYLQLSGRRPNTQDQFNTLAFTACIRVCVCVHQRVRVCKGGGGGGGVAQCCPSLQNRANLNVKLASSNTFCIQHLL